MADATLADVVKKLDQVKSAVKAGDAVTATSSAKAEEAGAEKARDDAELKSIFEAIRDKLGLKGEGKPEDEEGYVKEVRLSDLEKPWDDDLIDKLLNDFELKNLGIEKQEIIKKIEECSRLAVEKFSKT